jgi:hypothetical protein
LGSTIDRRLRLNNDGGPDDAVCSVGGRSGTATAGYRDSDTTRPFAKYFRDCTEPIQEHVRYVLLGGMSPPEYGYDIDDAARMSGQPGHQRMETGWTRLDNGVTLICCRTEMAAVTAAMWDWWFGWFGVDTARYKLWYPDAHLYSGLGYDRSGERSTALWSGRDGVSLPALRTAVQGVQ